MSRYSLWNPFLFSAFHDPRTFKDDDPGPSNDDPGPSNDNQNTQTNQDRINEIYAESDDPWAEHGDELNDLVNDRSGTYTVAPATAAPSSNDDKPALSASAQAQVGTVKQDENGDWYAVVQNPNSNTLGRDYSIDPQDDNPRS